MINVNHLPNKLVRKCIWYKMMAKTDVIPSVTIAIIFNVYCIAKGHLAESVRGGYTIYQKDVSRMSSI